MTKSDPVRVAFVYRQGVKLSSALPGMEGTMLAAGFYNMDCMEAMRCFPDGYFDLAIVDPPYGDGNANIGGGVGSGDCSTGTKWNRFGQRFDRYKNTIRRRNPFSEIPPGGGG